MSFSIEFSSSVQKVVKKWKKSNSRAFKKLRDLLPELEQHPRSGTGHPEPLKGGNDVTWSRHITAHDRIVYDIYDEVLVVLVIDAEDHYDDK